MGGVAFLDLPCLASGRNLDLTFNHMADLWRQCISFNDNNYPTHQKTPYEVPQPEVG